MPVERRTPWPDQGIYLRLYLPQILHTLRDSAPTRHEIIATTYQTRVEVLGSPSRYREEQRSTRRVRTLIADMIYARTALVTAT